MTHTATAHHLYAGWVERTDGSQRAVHAHLHCAMTRYRAFSLDLTDPVSQGITCDLCRHEVAREKEASDLALSAD